MLGYRITSAGRTDNKDGTLCEPPRGSRITSVAAPMGAQHLVQSLDTISHISSFCSSKCSTDALLTVKSGIHTLYHGKDYIGMVQLQSSVSDSTDLVRAGLWDF
jgi:hypothetical protein